MMEEEAGLESGTIGIINFRNQESEQLPILTDQLHRLPCCIKFDGPSAVSQYFKPKPTGMEARGLRVEESYFRGRKLLGATLPLPPGYSGFVLGKKNVQKRKATDLCEQNSSNRWEVNAKFENITYWNNESLPSQDDTFFRSFHWLSVAEALHKPVTAEDLASASINLEKKAT
ncbi:uncharacterized protein [Euphorbia lathyris]|uniref:uncharacterized protein n=1 Tax=Euphorbia lathyris TaxID=212925 RepID=UPI0033134BEB